MIEFNVFLSTLILSDVGYNFYIIHVSILTLNLWSCVFQAPIVFEDFIYDSIKAKKMLDIEEYRF